MIDHLGRSKLATIDYNQKFYTFLKKIILLG